MALSKTYRPNLEDFFPSVARGHSIGANSTKIRGLKFDADGTNPRLEVIATRKVRCVNDQCSLNSPKSKQHHLDKAGNIKSWEEERGGVKLLDFYTPRVSGLVSVSVAA
jgi:hypothetical protein